MIVSDFDAVKESILTSIRETGCYSSRNASKGAMLQELHRLLVALKGEYTKEKSRELVFKDDILNKNTFENRRAIWNRLNHRYFNVYPKWIASSLAKVALSGVNSAEFISLSYLYYALRDRISYDFIGSTIWKKWNAGITSIGTTDFMEFLVEAQRSSPDVKKWREITQKRLGSGILAALRDFGLLRGTVIKHIQRPTIAPETSYHLLAILWAEGKRGREIIEASDWKLFLWNETETSDALIRLAQLGWIKFERGGKTVILDMLRTPEANPEESHVE